MVSDGTGTVTLLILTEDISASTFSLSNVYWSSVFPRSFSIDPTFKINQNLETINTGNDLQNAQLQGGGSLLSGLDVAATDVDEAAQAIAQLHNRLSSSQTTSLNTSVEIAESQSKFRSGKVRRGVEMGDLLRVIGRIASQKPTQLWVRYSLMQ